MNDLPSRSTGYRGPYVVFSLEEIRDIAGTYDAMLSTREGTETEHLILEKAKRALEYPADHKLRQPHK